MEWNAEKLDYITLDITPSWFLWFYYFSIYLAYFSKKNNFVWNEFKYSFGVSKKIWAKKLGPLASKSFLVWSIQANPLDGFSWNFNIIYGRRVRAALMFLGAESGKRKEEERSWDPSFFFFTIQTQHWITKVFFVQLEHSAVRLLRASPLFHASCLRFKPSQMLMSPRKMSLVNCKETRATKTLVC